MSRERFERQGRAPSALMGRAAKYREPGKELDPVVYALRKRRYEMGLSLPALGDLMDYDPNTIAGWECGLREPALKSLRLWCKALNMRMTATPEDFTT